MTASAKLGDVPALSLRDVGYSYAGSGTAALAGVDLDVAAGEIIGVVGANDAGKSTLALVAAGLAPQAIGGRLTGSVIVLGTSTLDLRPHELAQRVGILFQNPATQISGTTRTVWEEVAFGPRNLGLPIGAVVERVASAIELLGIRRLAERDPQRLSGGEGQLLALASVLALQPSVLVLDEPTSQLDPAGTDLIGEALDRLAQAGTAIVLIEHKTDLVDRLASRLVILARGRIVGVGPAPELLRDDILGRVGVEPPSAARLARALQASGLSADVVSG